MKENLTELVFIVDMSGSMSGTEEDTVGGINTMLKKQRELEGEMLVSTVVFNNQAHVIHDRVPLTEIPDMTLADYTPTGCTALLDALGGAIHHIGNVHKYARPEDVPEHTIFIITTDGLENASRVYTSQKVKSMIEHEKEKYGWEFIFLAANIDAVETAEKYGIDRSRAVNYHNDERGREAMSYSACKVVSAVRSKISLEESDWRDELDADYISRKK